MLHGNICGFVCSVEDMGHTDIDQPRGAHTLRFQRIQKGSRGSELQFSDKYRPKCHASDTARSEVSLKLQVRVDIMPAPSARGDD